MQNKFPAFGLDTPEIRDLIRYFFFFQKNPAKLWFKKSVTIQTTSLPQLVTIWRWNALPLEAILHQHLDGSQMMSKSERATLKKTRGQEAVKWGRGPPFRGWYFLSRSLMTVPPSVARLNIQLCRSLFLPENYSPSTVSVVLYNAHWKHMTLSKVVPYV